MRDRLAVEHEPLERERLHGLGDGDELGRPVAPVAGPQPHLVAVLMGDDAIAIVLELVQPAVTVRHLGGKDRLARFNEAGRQLTLRPSPALRCRTHQHGWDLTRAGPACR